MDAIARCMRCARASSSRTSSSSRSGPACSTRSTSSASASAGSGRWPSTPAQVVEVGGVEGRSDLVDPLEVVGDPPQAGQLVVASIVRRRVAQAGDEVAERGRVPARVRARGSRPDPAGSRGSRRSSRTPIGRRSRTTRGTTASRCRGSGSASGGPVESTEIAL